MNGKIFLIIGIVVLSIILLIGASYLFVLSGAIFSFGSNPPKPEITYGEFPFKLTYELNGEIKVIEDVAICEFDGFGPRSSAGQSRKWKSSLKSGNGLSFSADEKKNETDMVWITLLDTRQTNDTDSLGNKVLELYFFGGNGHYYMGDKLGGHDRNAQGFDYISYLYQKVDGTIGHSSFNADEAWEKYKIRFISWEIADPIQNTFK